MTAKQNFNTPEMKRRILMTVAGVLIMGMSVGLFSLSALGMDPFQIFAHGIWRIINTAAGHPVTSEAEMPGTLSFGLCYTVLSAIMLVVVLLINRRKIGLGTLINILFVGYVADFSESLFGKLIPDRSFLTRLIILLVALVILCMASSLYFTADLGVSVYDAMSLTVSERTPIPFQICRIASDLICVVIGGILCYLSDRNLTSAGALLTTAGIGTIITAFFMGPFIAFFNRKIAEPLRYGS